ncbi:hypothetical protein ZIOFF_051269 [Zingiber officinale]|uniref:Uncharacterized protein n=1 Tax=Zingiber officinale TaxID=94328 RepID=A0A8J5FIF4_ZINOF|nr:hypothetical protein ZIOFF_051269 [Zingiber officinale]
MGRVDHFPFCFPFVEIVHNHSVLFEYQSKLIRGASMACGGGDIAALEKEDVGVEKLGMREKHSRKLPFPMDYLYADSERKAYGALGLYFGLGRTFFNPASTKVFSRWESIKKANKNYTITATPDDRSSVLQQGGMFVFKGKQLLYGRKDEGTGDHAPLDEILNICNNAKIA